MRRTFWWAAMVGLGCFVGSAALWAQDRGDESRRDRDEERRDRDDDERRDRGDRDERSERRFDPSDILRRMDRNGDGQLEPDEISERARRFVTDAAAKAGLDPSKPIAIDKLIGGFGSPGESSTPATSTPAPTTKAAPAVTVMTAPLIPGFGVASALSPVPGFDVPLSKSNRFQRPLEERFDKAVIDRVDDLLRQMDTNKDGKIEYGGDEGRKNRWQGDPKDSDLDRDGKLDREELCKRIAKLIGSREKTPEESTRSGGSSSSSSSDDQRAKFRRYAEGLLKQNDGNSSGVLEKDEWSKMRGDYSKADTNGDSVLTLDELTDQMANYSRDSGSSSGGDSGNSESSRRGSYRDRGSRDASSATTDRRSFRLLTPTERLPKGLPTWFTRNDVDADAQISMAEYSTSWNDTTAAEFAKYDLNSDGMITPDECLAGEKEKLPKK